MAVKPTVQKKIVPKLADVKEQRRQEWANQPKLPNIRDLMGKEFIITGFQVNPSNKFPGTEWVIITTDKGEFSTSSGVIIKQLRENESIINDTGLSVSVEAVDRYLTLI